MTDYDRPVHDPTTDADDTTSTEAPPTPIATTPTRAVRDAAGRADDRPRAAIAARWVAAGRDRRAHRRRRPPSRRSSLTGSSPASTVARLRTRADSVAYGELRLDLPGDQRQEVGEFLSASSRASPIRPRSTPSSTRSSTGCSPRRPRASRPTARDIKPWFDGELGVRDGPAARAIAAIATLRRSPSDAALLSAVGQGRGAGPGLVHGRPHRDRRHRPRRRRTTAPS